MSIIGITAVTPKAAAMSYLHIVETALKKRGKHPEIIIQSNPIDLCLQAIQQAMQNRPKQLIELLLCSLEKLSSAGATLAIIPNNSSHLVIEELQKKSPIQCISIIEPVLERCKSERFRKVCMIGPSAVIQSKMYEPPLAEEGIGMIVPDMEDQQRLQKVIFDVSKKGCMPENQKSYVRDLFNKLKENNFFDVVIVSCSELVDVITPEFAQIPVINPFLLQAEATLKNEASY